MCRLTQRLAILGSVGSLMILVGAGLSVPDRHPGKLGAAGQAEPTLEEARRALIALVEGLPEEERAFFRLADLRAGRALVSRAAEGGGWHLVEQWNCDLQARAFVFPGPPRPHGCTRTDHGVFEFRSGSWQARFEGVDWACSK